MVVIVFVKPFSRWSKQDDQLDLFSGATGNRGQAKEAAHAGGQIVQLK
jgi:hypothetical protein